MLQNIAWHATDTLARNQFHVFRQIGDEMQLSDDAQRRVLLLSERQWADWSEFRQHGPLPAEPRLPVMLRRLGSAAHRLAVLADRRAART